MRCKECSEEKGFSCVSLWLIVEYSSHSRLDYRSKCLVGRQACPLWEDNNCQDFTQTWRPKRWEMKEKDGGILTAGEPKCKCGYLLEMFSTSPMTISGSLMSTCASPQVFNTYVSFSLLTPAYIPSESFVAILMQLYKRWASTRFRYSLLTCECRWRDYTKNILISSSTGEQTECAAGDGAPSS